MERGYMWNILLECLLEDFGHITEAASHHAAEDVVELVFPCPLFLHIVNLENTVRRDTRRSKLRIAGQLTSGLTTWAEWDLNQLQ